MKKFIVRAGILIVLGLSGCSAHNPEQDPAAQFATADSLYRAGNFTQAANSYRTIANQNREIVGGESPAFAACVFALATCLLHTGEVDSADSLFRMWNQIMSAYPDQKYLQAGASMRYARILAEINQVEKSEGAMLLSLAICDGCKPGDEFDPSYAMSELAALYVGTGQREKGIQTLKDMIRRRSPNGPDCDSLVIDGSYRLSLLLMDGRRYDEAVAILKGILDEPDCRRVTDSLRFELTFYLAISLRNAGDTVQSMDQFRIAELLSTRSGINPETRFYFLKSYAKTLLSAGYKSEGKARYREAFLLARDHGVISDESLSKALERLE